MANSQENGTQGKRFLFCSYPRSGSHLLMRMINIHEQPNFVVHPAEGDHYFFLPPWFARLPMNNFGQIASEFKEEHRVEMKKNFQISADRTTEFLQQAGSNDVFIKEHVQIITSPETQSRYLYPERHIPGESWSVTIDGHSKVSPENPLLLPDDYLLTFLPFFTIRHPATVVPSMARAFSKVVVGELDENAKSSLRLATGLRFTRLLYDFLEPKLNKKGWPLIMEANDIIKNPDVVLKFMEMVGLDKSLMQSTWKTWDEERVASLPPLEAHMMSTLIASSGVRQDKARSVVIDEEVEKWKEEFGPEMASFMHAHVLDTMPDYEYLYSKRLQV